MIRVDRPQSLFCFIPQEKGLIRWVWGLARSEGISPIFAVPSHLHLLQTNIPIFALALTIWGRQTDILPCKRRKYDGMRFWCNFLFLYLPSSPLAFGVGRLTSYPCKYRPDLCMQTMCEILMHFSDLNLGFVFGCIWVGRLTSHPCKWCKNCGCKQVVRFPNPLEVGESDKQASRWR